jgi:4-hydroxy-tetrahydrodipicolinate synthase
MLTTACVPLLHAGAAKSSSNGSTGKLPTTGAGLWPVMLTPFHEDGSIDWKALDALTNWYVENGADGLFACCQSSEVWDLTEQERIQVVKRVLKQAGKVPVVAGGLPGMVPQTVAPFIQQLADAGASAAVLTTCQVTEKAEPDTVWKQRVEMILNASNHLPFGLYEAPRPYKRLLTPELMNWAGHTNRFVFHKDTSCEITALAAKAKAVDGTPLRLFNAHVPLLVEAIRQGVDGFSGIAANAYPAVISFAVHHYKDQAEKADRVQAFLTKSEPTLNFRYPLSVKVLANLAGVPIKPVCRRRPMAFNDEQMAKLRALRNEADRVLA